MGVNKILTLCPAAGAHVSPLFARHVTGYIAVLLLLNPLSSLF